MLPTRLSKHILQMFVAPSRCCPQHPGAIAWLVEFPLTPHGDTNGPTSCIAFLLDFGDRTCPAVNLDRPCVPAGLRRRANCRTGGDHSNFRCDHRGSSNGNSAACRHSPTITHCSAACCGRTANTCGHLPICSSVHAKARSYPDALSPGDTAPKSRSGCNADNHHYTNGDSLT